MTLRSYDGLGWIPRSFGIVYAIGFGTVFIMAVFRRDVTPYLPLVSETGAKPPESGLFTITTYILAAIGGAIVVLRYLIIEECNQQKLNRAITKISKVSLAIGLISMLALAVAGACTMMIMAIPHGAAAIVMFCCSYLYGLLETITTYKMIPDHANKFIFITRSAIVSSALLIMLTFSFGATVGRNVLKVFFPANEDEWTGCKTPAQEGFAYMVVGSTCEWLLSILFVAYFLTFIFEFNGASFYIDIRKSNSMTENRQSVPYAINLSDGDVVCAENSNVVASES